jgi:exonuclease VII large subunit
LSQFQLRILESLSFNHKILKQYSLRLLNQIEKAIYEFHPRTFLQHLLKKTSNVWQKLNSIKLQENFLNRILRDYQFMLEDFFRRQESHLKNTLNRISQRLEKMDGLIIGLNPLEVLNRGFVIVRKNKKIMTSATELVQQNDHVFTLQFHDGNVEVKK